MSNMSIEKSKKANVQDQDHVQVQVNSNNNVTNNTKKEKESGSGSGSGSGPGSGSDLDIILQNYFNEFVINVRKIMLLFNELAPSSETTNFLKVFNGLKWDKIISRYYLKLDKQCEQLSVRDIKIFESKIYAFPEIDISATWNKINSSDEINKEKIWTLLQKLYVSSFFLVEGSSKDMLNETKMKLIKKIETDINKRDISFNPFSGINVDTKTEKLSMEDLNKGDLPTNKSGSESKTGMLASLLGVDKMIDIKSLKEQLKKIDKKEIEEATNNITSLLGDSIDKNLVSEMITSVSDELKQKISESDNPIESIMGVAESVAKKMAPKIDPKKINVDKLMESSKSFAKNCKDKDGKPLFTGGLDPFSMLSGMLGKTKTDISEKDCLNQCQQMLGALGNKTNAKGAGIDFNNIFNTLATQINNSSNSNNDKSDDKIIDNKIPKKKHHKHKHEHKHEHKHNHDNDKNIEPRKN